MLVVDKIIFHVKESLVKMSRSKIIDINIGIGTFTCQRNREIFSRQSLSSSQVPPGDHFTLTNLNFEKLADCDSTQSPTLILPER